MLSLLKKNEENSPKKLRIYFRISLFLFLIRYLTLLLICLLKNVERVYIFKNLVYLNYLVIPLVVFALFFIYLRFEKISFNIVYIASGIVGVLYLIFMKLSSGIVRLDINFGYIIQLKYGEFITSIIVLMLAVFLIISVIFIDKPNIDKKGIGSLILILVIVLIENILILIKCSVLPYMIISEVIFLIVIEKAIKNFGKTRLNIDK